MSDQHEAHDQQQEAQEEQTTVTNYDVLRVAESTVNCHGNGVGGVSDESIYEALIDEFEGDIEKSLVYETITDNVGKTAAFTRLYNGDDGLLVASDNFWPIVNAILDAEHPVKISEIITKLPAVNCASCQLSLIAIRYQLSLIETMIEHGYLKLSSDMYLTLDDGLISTD